MKLIPKKYVVQIADGFVPEFLMFWMFYGKPCNLLLQKPKTEGLVAIRVIIDSDESASFLYRAMEKIRFKIYEV